MDKFSPEALAALSLEELLHDRGKVRTILWMKSEGGLDEQSLEVVEGYRRLGMHDVEEKLRRRYDGHQQVLRGGKQALERIENELRRREVPE